jgi:hypothetical protein
VDDKAREARRYQLLSNQAPLLRGLAWHPGDGPAG